MLDWKILAASFAALLFISSALIGGGSAFGIGDTFSGIMDKISQWLGGSSVSLSTPEEGQEVEILITPNILIIPIETDTTINIDSVTMKDFSGEIIVDYENEVVNFMSNDMEISTPLQEIKIKETEINKLILEEITVEIIHDEWSEKTEKSKVEIVGFVGDIEIMVDMISLKGTVSNIAK